MTMTQSFAPHLPYLRRYARALTGSQSAGDSYVRATLSALLEKEQSVAESVAPRVGLYQVFHAIWSSASGHIEAEMAPPQTENKPSAPQARLAMLDAHKRAALLLTAVEAFTLDEAAFVMDETPQEIERAIVVVFVFDAALHALQGGAVPAGNESVSAAERVGEFSAVVEAMFADVTVDVAQRGAGTRKRPSGEIKIGIARRLVATQLELPLRAVAQRALPGQFAAQEITVHVEAAAHFSEIA